MSENIPIDVLATIISFDQLLFVRLANLNKYHKKIFPKYKIYVKILSVTKIKKLSCVDKSKLISSFYYNEYSKGNKFHMFIVEREKEQEKYLSANVVGFCYDNRESEIIPELSYTSNTSWKFIKFSNLEALLLVNPYFCENITNSAIRKIKELVIFFPRWNMEIDWSIFELLERLRIKFSRKMTFFKLFCIGGKRNEYHLPKLTFLKLEDGEITEQELLTMKDLQEIELVKCEIYHITKFEDILIQLKSLKKSKIENCKFIKMSN